MSTTYGGNPGLVPLHVVLPEDGQVGPLRILAGGDATRGLYFALEWETPPAPVDAPIVQHSHEEHDESEYVVTGEREILVDAQRWRGGAGMFVLAPRRSLHTMRTVGSAASRWLHFFSPAGLEHFFVERERLRAEGASSEVLRALAQRFGTLAAPTTPTTEQPFAAPASAQRGGVVVGGAHTRSAYALAEFGSLPGDTHVHNDLEEAFYVNEGELVVHVNGASVVAPPRSFSANAGL
jgi:uncharacterized cupin superfamily protein